MRLILDGLAGVRTGRTLFSDLSLVLETGEALLVTGPNGSGKSTLLRIVAGLLAPAAGEARLENAGPEFPSLGSASHFLGDGNALKSGQTVMQSLEFWSRFQGRPGLSIDDALARVQLPTVGELPVEALSKGMRRRIAIARLLVTDLPIWLLDEPTSGLDTAAVARFEELIAERRRTGGIVIVASHHDLRMGSMKMLDLDQRMEPAGSLEEQTT
ncbi:heme ABC exporter ATP-binding protein CcmA [Notoacmeibacter ruber]|uniref:Heme ABC exporter ATP-binding protein CcmA n=1 Tax=Notoacmeibacter ruber TaxID=2670375 RepID=A0A3L7JFK5_9HYPH|nr:heme ABC exporter ATP-binding protein CcmA [Notoacmeibacter ruber]RLQ89105.1 heme ABC exporter ATP-binding protein CcmA [Notoacmeibacter ruber]